MAGAGEGFAKGQAAPPTAHSTNTAATPPASPTSIGKFDTWTAYTMPDNGKLMCYALSNPASMADKSKRAKAYLMVTHRPAEKTLNVVSIELGYPTTANGSAAVAVGKQKFDFFTRDQTAWSRDSDTDKTVVTVMRKSETLTIKAKPAKAGAETTDSYSLLGFPAALDAIDKACKVKR